MKNFTITNANNALCLRCFSHEAGAVIGAGGTAICAWCGGFELTDRHTGQPFQPIYGPAKTYRASQYTPELPCRRVNTRPWPKAKEQRRQVHAG